MLRIILSFVILAIISTEIESQAANDACLKAFREALLVKHNELRKLHRSKEVNLDDKINQVAQDYANQLAKANSGLKHSNTEYGENLAFFGNPAYSSLNQEVCAEIGKNSAQMWYNEVKDYNFESPKPLDRTKVTGHFTQLVWKASTKVGFGLASNGNNFYVVANYHKAGNVISMDQDGAAFYKVNVLPKKIKSSTII